MQVHTFIAESAVQAVERIRQQLGPHAVVLNVRKLPGEGLARFWQKPRIEVLACVPEMPAAVAPVPDPLAELRQELAEIREEVRQHKPAPETGSPGFAQFSEPCQGQPQPSPTAVSSDDPSSRPSPCPTVAGLLESSGLLQIHVQRVLDDLRADRAGQPACVAEACHSASPTPAPPDMPSPVGTSTPAGRRPAESLAQELRLAQAALIRLWRPTQPGASNFHVFIGPPGAGKTTALSKWLAQAALVEGRRARVWRLDSHVANTAESLSVLAEVLGVPVERCRPNEFAPDPSELVFVDLPGVSWNDPVLLNDLARQLAGFPGAEVHLVLNAAYEGQLLLAQGRAYSGFPVHDIILTHLDEEPRWAKLWNLVLGTNFSVGYLSAGQNIPGDFQPADPETILARHFPRV